MKAKQPGYQIVFVDVSEGKEASKKESFINQIEAEAVIDYYMFNIQESQDYLGKIKEAQAAKAKQDMPSLCMVSPFRTQAHLIRQVMGERSKDEEGGDKVVIQESKKFKKDSFEYWTAGNKKEQKDKMLFQRITDVTCLEDIVSCGGRSPHCPNGFSTVMISLCRTQNFQEEDMDELTDQKQSQILNNPEVIRFLESKVRDRLIIFGQSDKLNQLWKELYDKASEVVQS